jgi:hypothetical protein
MNNINLNECVPGQKLRSRHGLILTYVVKDGRRGPWPHVVKYPPSPELGDNSFGTRTDNGEVFINKPLQSDHDIVEILPLEE